MLVVFVFLPMPIKEPDRTCFDCYNIHENYGFPLRFHVIGSGGIHGQGINYFSVKLLILDLLIYFLVFNVIFYSIKVLRTRD